MNGDQTLRELNEQAAAEEGQEESEYPDPEAKAEEDAGWNNHSCRDLDGIISRAFIRTSTHRVQFDEPDFLKRFARSLEYLGVQRVPSDSVVEYFVSQAKAMNRQLADWEATRESFAEPRFIATQKYLEAKCNALKQERQKAIQMPNPDLPQEIKSWEHKRLMTQLSAFVGARRYFSSLARAKTLGRTEVVSHLLAPIEDELGKLLHRSAGARGRGKLMTAFVMASGVVAEDSEDPQRAVAMRKLRAKTSSQKKVVLELLFALLVRKSSL